MSRASVFKTFAFAAFVALGLIACFEPRAFALIRLRASENALWLVLSLATAAVSAKLTLAVPAFGANAHVSTPLLLLLAAPYALRAALWKSGALNFASRKRFGSAAPSAPNAAKPGYPPGVPAALPPRVAVALAAAARARA